MREASAVGHSIVESINDREFRLFQRLMFSEAGITLSASKKALVRGRLSKRLKERGCANFDSYYSLVNSDQEERQCAIDLLTTNETYFFREPKHFAFLRDTALAGHKKGRDYRAWSAACSSGEEVYSIAMVLADELGTKGWSVQGSDLNKQVLAKAQQGHYGLARTEGIPRHLLQKYCLKGKGAQIGTFLVGRELRAQTTFRQINLNVRLPRDEPYDCIFLRNVMIYFGPETKAQVVNRVASALRPGGYLFIGHSESLNGISTSLKLVRPSIYRRPE